MNSTTKTFLLSILLSVLTGIFANILTPYFQNSTIIVTLVTAILVVMLVIINADIRNWLVEKRILAKAKRIKEL